MSSAPARIVQLLGRVLRGAVWTVLFVVLAISGAGLVDGTWQAPGTAARAELTWAGDTAVGHRLDVATVELERIAADVDALATHAKTALAEVSSPDPTRLNTALTDGADIAAAIDSATLDLRNALIGLPGDGPDAAFEFKNATLVRRAAILAAIDAAAGLASRWAQVQAKAGDAARLTALIASHDATVLQAAATGVAHGYGEAAAILDGAVLTVADVKSLRVKLIASTDPTVLDEWIERNLAYDLALKAVYTALVASNGEVTVTVQSARRDEQAALARLPPDRRTILVIISEVSRGGLTQAVLSIEEARGRIGDALAEAGPG